MKRAYFLSALALLVGLGLGLSVLAIERKLLTELLDSLESELQVACPSCKIERDAVQLSLLRLHATASNVRILDSDQVKLRFARIEADFSLSAILDRKVLLTELRLINGFSFGVDPDSVTYRFIDQLSTAPPPERRSPDRWQVKLLKLTVAGSEFSERLGSSIVHGHGVAMTMQRNAADNFEITPSIDDLQLTLPSGTKTASLGVVDGLLEITDERVHIRKLRLTRRQGRFEAAGAVLQQPRGPLEGDAHFSLDDDSISISDFATLALYGAGTLSGTIGRPEITASFSNPTAQPFVFKRWVQNPVEFPWAKGDFSLTWDGKDPEVKLSYFEAKGPAERITLIDPFLVNTDGMSGAFRFEVDQFDYDEVTLRGLNASFSLKFPWAMPVWESTFDAQSISVAGADLGSLHGTSTINEGDLAFAAATSPTDQSLPIVVETQGSVVFGEQLVLLPTKLHVSPRDAQAIPAINLTAQVAGPFSLTDITGQGEFSLGAGTRAVHGSAELQQGVLLLHGSTPEGDLLTDASFGITPSSQSSISLVAKEANPLSFAEVFSDQDQQCAKVSGNFTYRFNRDSPLRGDGAISIPQLATGCGRYQVSLSAPFDASIQDGALTVASLKLGNQNSSVVTSGNVSLSQGLNLTIRGVLDTPSLAPLLGKVDDLRGNVALNATVTGPLTAPALGGQVSVENGSLTLEATGFNLSEVTGAFTFVANGLDFSDISGKINEGSFELSGRIEPFAIERSVATATFKGVLLEPLPEISSTISGTVGVGPDRDGASAISGVVTIDGAEFRKTLNWADILRTTAQSLLSPRSAVDALPDRMSLPEVPLDLHVTAPANLVVETTWGSGEMKADLRVRGTIRDPLTEGLIEVIGGWVGLRDRRFEITSGRVEFKPPSFDPEIEVLAETTMRSRQGDVVLVLLEVSGTASAPRFKLTSDRGLNEREILALFTARGDFTSSPRLSGFASGMELDALEAIEDRSFLGIGRLVRDLARIDSLSLEPTFSTQRGTVEPSLVAQKQLFDHLALVAETPLGATQTDSRLRLVFDASPALEFSAGLETATRENRTSAGVDVAYTLLGERRRYLDIRMSGNRMFRSIDIQSAVRLSDDSRINESQLPQVVARITEFYRQQGFHDSTVTARCSPVAGFVDDNCHQLLLDVSEGRPTYIGAVRVEGDAPPPAIQFERLSRPLLESVATEATRKAFEQRLINAMRSEGFIAARATSRYQDGDQARGSQEEPRRNDLVVQLTLGEPVTFNFRNNYVFSAEDFLATIDLFGRRQPFGNNTISILIENIERKYNEAGYLFASATVERHRDDTSGRVTYDISIDEGPPVAVAAVELVGTSEEAENELRQSILESDEKVAALIFHPNYAVPDQLAVNALTLQRALADQGFPNAAVTVQTVVNDEQSEVLIRYNIEEGDRLRATRISVEGAPVLEREPTLPTGPLSIPQLNKFVSDYSQALVAHGYRNSTVSAAFAEGDHLILSVNPGPLFEIAEVLVQGYSSCDEKVIRNELLLKEGSPWDEERIQESRRRLLRLGLFSKVAIEVEELSPQPSRGRLIVNVHERSLRTLSVGIGANSELGLHLFGEASDRKLFGDGKSLTARLDAYYDDVATTVSQGVASLSFANPTIFDNDFGFVSDVRFQRFELDTQEFDLDRVALANYIHRSWESGVSFSLGHTILEEDLSNVTPGAIVGEFDTGNVRLGFLSSVITFDRRDDPLLPSRGYNLGLEGQYAQELFGSEANYVSLLGRGSFLTPLSLISPRWSLASNTRVGSGWTGPNTDAVPISQRFYLGGRSTVRGYKENSLGPLGFDGAVQGGDLLFIQNLELRYRLGDATQLVNFLDVGGLYFHDRAIAADDLREGAGVGFRYLSPIGPIGFDLGFPLDRRDGESAVRFHFSIGTNY